MHGLQSENITSEEIGPRLMPPELRFRISLFRPFSGIEISTSGLIFGQRACKMAAKVQISGIFGIIVIKSENDPKNTPKHI